MLEEVRAVAAVHPGLADRQTHAVFLDRVSKDLDLFTVDEARTPFQEAVASAVDAHRGKGFDSLVS